jgi:matrixin
MPKRQAMKVRFATAVIVTLVAIGLPSPAGAYQLEGGRWPTATITYFNEVPAYAWAVDSAAYAWNTSGARVQFVKGSRRDAKVLLGIRWFKARGEARVHHLNGRFVSAKVGIQSGQDRYTMALVTAHELGHVLGLGHEDRVCATMNSQLVANHPENCPAAPQGMWVCRLLRTDDVRGAVRLYGGAIRPIRGPEFCNK